MKFLSLESVIFSLVLLGTLIIFPYTYVLTNYMCDVPYSNPTCNWYRKSCDKCITTYKFKSDKCTDTKCYIWKYNSCSEECKPVNYFCDVHPTVKKEWLKEHQLSTFETLKRMYYLSNKKRVHTCF